MKISESAHAMLGETLDQYKELLINDPFLQ